MGGFPPSSGPPPPPGMMGGGYGYGPPPSAYGGCFSGPAVPGFTAPPQGVCTITVFVFASL